MLGSSGAETGDCYDSEEREEREIGGINFMISTLVHVFDLVLGLNHEVGH